jgi:hypothetical protein
MVSRCGSKRPRFRIWWTNSLGISSSTYGPSSRESLASKPEELEPGRVFNLPIVTAVQISGLTAGRGGWVWLPVRG